MSANAGWYPDPGGGADLFRYWDGRVWSAATSPNPAAPPPAQGLGTPPAPAGGSQPFGGQAYGGQAHGALGGGRPAYGQQAYGSAPGNPYADHQQTTRRRSGAGWWIAGAVLAVVLVIVAVVAVRAVTGGAGDGSGTPGGLASQDACPRERTETPAPTTRPNDGRVHGGPVSYPQLGSPWGAPKAETRVPFGSDVQNQDVMVEPNYAPLGKSWVASVLVGELQAGDGFFTPEQGAQIVVKCILGKFYDDNPVTSDVVVNRAATIDGREAWIVESQLSFDIRGLQTKGELLIVAIVANGATSGLFYASIPDTTPELVQPARNALAQLRVSG